MATSRISRARIHSSTDPSASDLQGGGSSFDDAPQATLAGATASSVGDDSAVAGRQETAPAPLPLPPLTKLEMFLISFFSFAIFSNFTLDIVNTFVPIGEVTKEKLDTLIYPPKIIRTLWWFWVTEVDPILRFNKSFVWAFCVIAPFFFTPFYCTAIYGIVKRKSWVNGLGLFWAGVLLATLLPEIGDYYAQCDGLHWPHSWSGLCFVFCYSNYFLCPCIMILYFGRFPVRPEVAHKVLACDKWMQPCHKACHKDHEPIIHRPVDLVLAIIASVATLLCLTLPYYILLSKSGEKITDEAVASLVWPPQFIAQSFHAWSKYADPLWHINPNWIFSCAISMALYPLILIPLVYAFVTEQQWLKLFKYEEHVNMRQLGLVWAGWHSCLVVMYLVSTFWEAGELEKRTQDVAGNSVSFLFHPMNALFFYIPQIFYAVVLSVRLLPPFVFLKPDNQVGAVHMVGDIVENVFHSAKKKHD